MPKAAAAFHAAAAALLLLLLAVLLAGCPGTGSPRRAILILLDAARPDRFGCYGYPRPTTPEIDALAARGVVFNNHFAQGTHTRSALPPLLYSRYYVHPVFPGSDRIPYSAPEDLFRTLDPEVISLPRALSNDGIHTVMISAHTWLKPETAFASEFDEAHDLSAALPVDPAVAFPRAEAVIDFTIDWLRKSAHDDFFIYLHLMDTHFPHHLGEEARALLPPDVRRSPPVEAFTEAGGPKRLDAPLSEPERIYLDALYDGSLRHADRHIGRLLDHLGDALEETLVIVTSDHGEYLLERAGRLGHGYAWYDAMGKVPLIVSYPRAMAPDGTDALTENVDIAPTVLGLLGVAPPEGKRFDGVDLRAILRGEIPPRETVFMSQAARTERYKILFRSGEDLLLGDERPDRDALAGRLYDLREDPDESIDIWAEKPGVVDDLLDRYRRRMLGPRHRYLKARTDRQPTSAFAISAKYLRTSEEIPVTTNPDELQAFVENKTGWIRFDHPEGHFLVASGEAGPLGIDLPIPDGPYLLSAAMRGECTLAAGRPGAGPAGTTRALRARPFDPSVYFPWDPDQPEYGRIDVTGGIFEATIDPEPASSPLLILFLGFRPLLEEEATDPEEERKRLERLETLGYVE